jgi:alpha-amylase/alpha-mannosidase (GH57 family)
MLDRSPSISNPQSAIRNQRFQTMSQVYLAFYWHQHQPYYPDDVAGETLMPWVRMHGVKDYWGMAMHLEEFPEVRCTINLVPSLLVQLLAYTEHGAQDKLLRLSRLRAEDLSKDDAMYLLDNGFMANMDHMVRPFPRYFELHRMRGFGADSAESALKRFKPRDLRDLQVWANMTWIHPLAFEHDKRLAELRQKGRNFTEDEQRWLLDKHIELLREVIPLHRRLAERGQIELTCTPFYHPILPLLWDKSLAREAMPDVPMPRHREGYPEDAAWHIEEAVKFHEKVFGQKPLGMWPSEGSVCAAMIPKLAESGIRWIATDEEILSRSLDGHVGRDHRGFVRNCELLYRPWRAVQDNYSVDMIFRDHALSDLIGFEYQRMDAVHAADDFLGKLSGIGHATAHAGQTLVSVILDGENCWEYYPHGGVDFLRALYGRLAKSDHIRTTRVSEYLEQAPPRETLPKLFSGSWINHNFAIWIGHDEDRRAWDLLHETREYLKRRTARGGVAQEKLDQAWRELHIAEGSDWFWWFGDDHSSAQDALFDYLFRKHLQNIYTILDETPPPVLSKPISTGVHRKVHTDPRGFLQVKVDGRFSYFEWVNAGHYHAGGERGAMARVTQGPAKNLFFGFDARRMLVRLDTHGIARKVLVEHALESLRVDFHAPAGYRIVATNLGSDSPIAQLERENQAIADGGIELAVGKIVELSVPFEKLGVTPDQPLSFSVELFAGGASIDRLPREGTIDMVVPSPDFEKIMWQV